jgi:lipopolysaccharide export system permease protein
MSIKRWVQNWLRIGDDPSSLHFGAAREKDDFKWQKEVGPINLGPMRLLDRYLFRELLTPLAYCLIGIESFIIFVTAIGDGGKISDAKLHFWQTIEYSAAASMELIPYVLPLCLLLALLMAVTHHSRYNEITAMRAAGISLWRICLPYFITGIIASAALFVLNESVVPRSVDFASHLLARNTRAARAADHVPLNFNNESEHRMWFIREYYVNTGEMKGLKVVWTVPDGTSRILYADQAVRTNGVWIFRGDAQEFEEANDPKAIPVPMVRTNELAVPEFDETPEGIFNEMNIGFYLALGQVHTLDIPVKDMLAYLNGHPQLSRGDKGRLLTELQERLAKPFTCIVVVLIAIPFGAAPGRRNLFFGVAGSIFICFAFFVLSRLCEAFGANGSWPAWLAAWLPNIIFSILGLILTARIR